MLGTFQTLADEHQLIDKYKEILNGEFMNTGENRKVLAHEIALGEHYDAPRLALHQLPELRRAGEVTEREAHLPDDVVKGPVGTNGFTCN